MTKSSWAKHHMHENRNNQFRPEQITLYKQLRATRANSELLMEYTIKYTNEQGKTMIAIADIADLTKKEVFRLNGPIHNSNRAEVKDWEQKIYLEQKGWKVTDIEV
jgi:very-short-patch-repair endonuclease